MTYSKDLMELQMKQKHKSESLYTYEGVPIHAAKGLHEGAMDVIRKHAKGKVTALDFGCGSGAFTKRLQDNGFRTTSVDLSLDTFALRSECYEMDLNSDFFQRFSSRDFDVIVALEVIEHLENPLHFLRQLKLIANSKTLILVSFPNLYLYSSVYSFFINGAFANWSPSLYWETGHQTILTDWLFEEHLKKTGLVFEEKYYCGTFEPPPGHFVKYFLHKLFYALVCVFNTGISSKVRKNQVVIYQISNTLPSGAENT
jgi:2-polyprenyl-3-methyl-5-hydroxy-6-metoxy-1,4-benzoquinol methylase